MTASRQADIDRFWDLFLRELSRYGTLEKGRNGHVSLRSGRRRIHLMFDAQRWWDVALRESERIERTAQLYGRKLPLWVSDMVFETIGSLRGGLEVFLYVTDDADLVAGPPPDGPPTPQSS